MAKVCPSCELTYSDDDFFCAADGSPLRTLGVEADNLVGTVIADRYRVESILGEGGMGRVYRARHVRVPREAAIKVLRRALISDSYAVAAFNREARNAASVGDHPNVAAVYDFGETSDGLVFLAMEFIEGETLTRRLEREPVLPPSRAVDIVRQIAAGLTAAHELPEPVVHRDLKPDNILLKATRDGSDWVKLVDFGIAKAAKRDTQLLTTPGLVVGTPRYMSPEQLTGATVDTRSDIYALGIIAYQMLTGRMPFPSTSREEELTIAWALKRLTTAPMRLAEVRPEGQWPEAAEDVLQRALARDAAERPATARELGQALARAFGFSTPSSVVGVVTAAPGPVSSALQDAARAAAPTAPLTAAPGPASHRSATLPPAAIRTAGGVHSAASSPPPAAAAATPGQGVSRWALIAAVVAVVAAVGVWIVRGGTASGATGAATPNDSASGPPVPTLATASIDSQTASSAAADSSTARPDTSAPVVRPPEKSRPDVPAAKDNRRPPTPNAATRGRLDQIKAAIADQDIDAATGARIIRDIRQLLPALTTNADSVEATYYLIETNLILDRPGEACRLLKGVRPQAQGTTFEGSIDRYLASAELGCDNR